VKLQFPAQLKQFVLFCTDNLGGTFFFLLSTIITLHYKKDVKSTKFMQYALTFYISVVHYKSIVHH
jgi:hypothetical protein